MVPHSATYCVNLSFANKNILYALVGQSNYAFGTYFAEKIGPSKKHHKGYCKADKSFRATMNESKYLQNWTELHTVFRDIKSFHTAS